MRYNTCIDMSDKTRNVIDYIVTCVNDFSDAHGMSYISGFEYLSDHGGVAFLERNYDIEHTYPIDETIENLASVCRVNGGSL